MKQLSTPVTVPDPAEAASIAGEAAESAYRRLPSVSSVLTDQRVRSTSRLSETALISVIQHVLSATRESIAIGETHVDDDVIGRVVSTLDRLEHPRLRSVINATGVIIHTNLGRSQVSDEAAAAMAAAGAHAVALEIDPETNLRGGRMDEITRLMHLLTGAEAALVVNNCAAAVLLVLSAVASDREVVVSRGEAVEIGGGFRVPDVLRQSGARLVEVGTTNRTYVTDYAHATSDATAAYLKVHPSNFRVEGFTHSVSTAELTGLGRKRSIPVLEDVGSGALLDSARYGLAIEPTMTESISAGASIVMASGDKLLGGPQAGLIIGDRRWVEVISKHPLARAVRADKTCLAGLAATLRHYARGEATSQIPVWRMIATPAREVEEAVQEAVRALVAAGVPATYHKTEATIGGGSLPGARLPSAAICLHRDALTDTVDALAQRLRTGDPPVFGRVDDDRLLLDLRTVDPREHHVLISAVSDVWSRSTRRQ